MISAHLDVIAGAGQKAWFDRRGRGIGGGHLADHHVGAIGRAGGARVNAVASLHRRIVRPVQRGHRLRGGRIAGHAHRQRGGRVEGQGERHRIGHIGIHRGVIAVVLVLRADLPVCGKARNVIEGDRSLIAAVAAHCAERLVEPRTRRDAILQRGLSLVVGVVIPIQLHRVLIHRRNGQHRGRRQGGDGHRLFIREWGVIEGHRHGITAHHPPSGRTARSHLQIVTGAGLQKERRVLRIPAEVKIAEGQVSSGRVGRVGGLFDKHFVALLLVAVVRPAHADQTVTARGNASHQRGRSGKADLRDRVIADRTADIGRGFRNDRT